MKSSRTLTLTAAIASGTVAVDLATKAVAASLFAGATRGVIQPVQNPAFSLGTVQGSTPVLLLGMVAGLIVGGAFSIRAARSGRIPTWIPGLLIGGSVANLIDRAAFGAVHDFLVVPGAILNLADLAVLAAVLGWSTALLTLPSPTPEGG